MKIMIIRHGEKPGDGGSGHGVSIDGEHIKHELTVRGWQRAGALVRFFDPVHPHPPKSAIATPKSIFASAAVEGSPSRRAQHTVEPLANALRMAVNASYVNGEEEVVAKALLAAESPVLIAWHHNHIGLLVKAIAGEFFPCPRHWPDERFDVVWVLDAPGPTGPWTLTQQAQYLLPGDSREAI